MNSCVLKWVYKPIQRGFILKTRVSSKDASIMPTDNENSMTNVEQAEKYWQQFLTAPALTDDDKAIAKQHHDELLTAFARS
ncbi:MAG TPA: hypothetical protein DDZ29_04410, partial [Alteromonas mediterranea]|nr:hypothetical protein [Alteromonas mediterranea]